MLRCDASLPLFGGAHRGLQALEPNRLLLDYGFCSLPYDSYHVTAFDVANLKDLERCHAEVRDEMRMAFDVLPGLEGFRATFLSEAVLSELASAEWDLSFGYGGLCIWGGVMVLLLAPLDEAAYGRFFEARTRLCRTYLEGFGVGGSEMYMPHLSLGYFLNHEASSSAAEKVPEWDTVLRSAVGDATVSFPRVSLYGFTDMATFFREAASVPPGLMR